MYVICFFVVFICKGNFHFNLSQLLYYCVVERAGFGRAHTPLINSPPSLSNSLNQNKSGTILHTSGYFQVPENAPDVV